MATRPNILLIVTEQHRGDCLSIENHPVLLTPNMDAIAGAGARFSRAYSTTPSCIPARRSLLSGQSPRKHGMVGFRDGVEWSETNTLGQVFADAGYETAWIGRGMHQHPHQKRFGFEHYTLLGGKYHSDYDDFFHERRPDDDEEAYGSGVMHNDWTARPWHLEEDLHPTSWTVKEALRFLKNRDSSRPFFLVVSFRAAHPPLNPPAFYFERYLRTGVPDPVVGDWADPPPEGGLGLDVADYAVDLKGEALLSARAGYYGLINHMDDHLRRILNPVTGIDPMTDGNTAVMLVSDHGEMLGDHYRWRKVAPYEGSARIPFLLRAPERFGIKPGTVCNRPVCLEDVMPTLLDLAGEAIPESVDGRSLLPLLSGGRNQKWREWLHIEHAPMHHTLTDGKEKFIWFAENGEEQFFDLSADPNETKDLSSDIGRSERIEQWRLRLVDALRDRPEGFTDGEKLLPGRLYNAVLPTVR